jgi:hypothetical protein
MPQPDDGGWGEEWSEDAERTYEASPPLDLTERQLRVYRKLAWHSGRAGIIPSQELLAEELGIPLRTLKRDIAALREKDVLDSDRRIRRGHRGGGRLLAGNQYFLKMPLNDLPDELFPPRGHRTEGPTEQVSSAQVTPRGQARSWPVGDGGQVEESASSDRGAKPVDNPPNTPTVSESKPVEERVSPQPSAQRLAASSGSPFSTMAEEKAWVAVQRRAGQETPAPPPPVRSSKQQELEGEVRVVARNAQRLAALRGDVVAVLWAGDVGFALEPEEAVLALSLRDEGLLEGATLVDVEADGPAAPPTSAAGPVRYGRWRLDGRPRDFHRAVDRLGWDTCVDASSCARASCAPGISGGGGRRHDGPARR